jgi:hypothetical protein
MWSTGERSTTSRSYRSRCGCRVHARVARGASFPKCPICLRETTWTDRETPARRRAAKGKPKPP